MNYENAPSWPDALQAKEAYHNAKTAGGLDANSEEVKALAEEYVRLLEQCRTELGF